MGAVKIREWDLSGSKTRATHVAQLGATADIAAGDAVLGDDEGGNVEDEGEECDRGGERGEAGAQRRPGKPAGVRKDAKEDRDEAKAGSDRVQDQDVGDPLENRVGEVAKPAVTQIE